MINNICHVENTVCEKPLTVDHAVNNTGHGASIVCENPLNVGHAVNNASHVVNTENPFSIFQMKKYQFFGSATCY